MKNTTNGLQLHKEHAVIHTASINVKILRLDKRQITMAVFRQLDEESIFLHDGTLRGMPWGRINYTWKENQDGTAFHVIWQDGDYLKRSAVPRYISEHNALSWLHRRGERDVRQHFVEPPNPGARFIVTLLDKALERIERWPYSQDIRLTWSLTDFNHRNSLLDWFRSKIIQQCPVGKITDTTQQSSTTWFTYSCPQSDKEALRTFLQTRRSVGERKNLEWENWHSDWKEKREGLIEGIQKQVDAMKKLDLLFIAV